MVGETASKVLHEPPGVAWQFLFQEDHRGGGRCAHSAAPSVGGTLPCACNPRGARATAHATALLSDATWLRLQGGGEEAGWDRPGGRGSRVELDEGRRAAAAASSGPAPHHGGWETGVVGEAVNPMGEHQTSDHDRRCCGCGWL